MPRFMKMWKLSRGIKEFTDRIDRLVSFQSECLYFNKSKKPCNTSTGGDKPKYGKYCIIKYFDCDAPKQFCSALSSHFRKNRQEKAGNSWHDLHLKHPHAWLGAVGWSGALVIGWYTLQPFLRWGCHYDSEAQRLQHERKYTSLFKIVRNVAFAQPTSVRSILPVLPSSESTRNLVEFGPISAEQALEEAAEALVKVREDIAAEVEHQHGMECIERKKYNKAVKHFKTASKLKYAPAAYNLALCYERGLGTSQDFKMAAHWYRMASDLGHAGAMYNLSVFHAHGWGGVKADPEKARQLLTSAAALGQMDAVSALQLDSEECPISFTSSPSSNSPSTEKIKQIKNTIQSYAFSPQLNKSNVLRKTVEKLSFSSASGFESDSSVSSPENIDLNKSENLGSPIWTDSGCSSSEQNCNEYYTGMCYENGWGVDENLPLAAEFYSKAALNGNAEALFNLAVCYEGNSTGIEHDPQLTMQLYRMAAEHGSVSASQRLKTLETYEAMGILNEFLKDSSNKVNLSKKPLVPH